MSSISESNSNLSCKKIQFFLDQDEMASMTNSNSTPSESNTTDLRALLESGENVDHIPKAFRQMHEYIKKLEEKLEFTNKVKEDYFKNIKWKNDMIVDLEEQNKKLKEENEELISEKEELWDRWEAINEEKEELEEENEKLEINYNNFKDIVKQLTGKIKYFLDTDEDSDED